MNLVATLEQLLAFRTITDDQLENGRALAWVRQQVASLPVFCTEKNFNGFPALLVTTQPTATPRLWLVAHMDVVPGPDKLFTARQEQGKLVGRGAYDMKFAIACYLQLLRDLGASLPQHDFGIMLTSDEETGGQQGVKMLLEAGYGSEVAIIPDGANDLDIEEQAKGVWQLSLAVRGQAGHAARPWEGDSATKKLLPLLEKITSLFTPEPCADAAHRHATCTIGMLQAGQSVNQIPDLATALLDIRFMDTADQARLQAAIEKIVHEVPTATLTTLELEPGFRTPREHPLVQQFAAITQAVRGSAPAFILSHGASDARFFARQGIPTIVTRPGGGGAHSDTEWIDLAELDTFYQILKQFVLATALQHPLPPVPTPRKQTTSDSTTLASD